MSDETADQDLATTDKSGNPPETRLKSSAAACRILKKMLDDDRERDRKRATIQGQIDGNPPYDDSKLKQLGQSNRSNVNFRQAEGIRDGRKSSYYDLLMEVDPLLKIKIRQNLNDPEMPMDYGEIIAEEISDMLKEWPGFWYHTQLHQAQFIVWGTGNCYWPNEIDWRFKAARTGSFLVPDETNANIEDLDLIAIRDPFKPFELFKYVKDAETEAESKAAGWNTDLVKVVLMNACKEVSSIDQSQLGDWASYQQAIKDNDLEYGYSRAEKIRTAHMMVKEYNDKISHFIIMEDAEYNKQEEGETEKTKEGGYLFKHVDRYESWDRALCLFLAGVGEGTYHSIRGLGAKIYAHCKINDRMMNATVDGAITAATIPLQPSNEGQREKIRIMRIGPFSVMPNGYNVVGQGKFDPNLNGLISTVGMLNGNLNMNVGLQRPDVTTEEKTPQAANTAEVRNRATKEAKLERSDIGGYYRQLDLLYREMVRRMLNPNLTEVDPGGKEAKECIQRCIDRGVPREYLKYEKLKVSARRAIGYGSPFMRSMISSDILSVSPYFDELGKDNAVRDYISARTGPEGVDRYKPIPNRNNIPTNEHSIANLETNDLKEGADVVVGTDQNHVIHLKIHIAEAVRIAEVFVNGQYQGPIEMLEAYLAASLRHIASHLDFIANDPARQDEYKMFFQTLNELAKVHATVQRQLQQQMKQQQANAERQAEIVRQAQEQMQDEKLRVELAKVEGDLQLRAMKEAGNQRVREAKAIHGMQIKEMLARHQMNIDNITKAQGA